VNENMLTLLDRNLGRAGQSRVPKLLAPLVAVWGKEPANELKPQKIDLVR
jgi:hypothetical protein